MAFMERLAPLHLGMRLKRFQHTFWNTTAARAPNAWVIVLLAEARGIRDFRPRYTSVEFNLLQSIARSCGNGIKWIVTSHCAQRLIRWQGRMRARCGNSWRQREMPPNPGVLPKKTASSAAGAAAVRTVLLVDCRAGTWVLWGVVCGNLE